MFDGKKFIPFRSIKILKKLNSTSKRCFKKLKFHSLSIPQRYMWTTRSVGKLPNMVWVTTTHTTTDGVPTFSISSVYTTGEQFWGFCSLRPTHRRVTECRGRPTTNRCIMPIPTLTGGLWNRNRGRKCLGTSVNSSSLVVRLERNDYCFVHQLRFHVIFYMIFIGTFSLKVGL